MNNRPIPSLTDLQQYNVNRPNQVEAIRSSLYDTVAYAQAGQTQLKFFQTPQGQSSKTLADTNMTAAGALPSPQSFLIETIELFLLPGTVPGITGGANSVPDVKFLNDVYNFYAGGVGAVGTGAWLDLFIGSKSYLDESPLMKFPPRSGLGGFSGMSAAASTASTAVSFGYAMAGGPVYELDPPILLVPTQNFNVSLNWPTAIAINTAARVTCQLGGILYRNSQ